jgi:hypothetical protein
MAYRSVIPFDHAGWSEAEIDRVYHPLPKDDGWREVTIAYAIENGRRLSLCCVQCQRATYVSAEDLAALYKIDWQTPLLILERSFRCTTCHLRLVHVREEPYSIERDTRGKTAPYDKDLGAFGVPVGRKP